MGVKVLQKQIESVFKLPAQERYEHFIKVAADWGEVWGLYNDGWAMSEMEDGRRVFPVWPAEGYANACAVDGWSSYKAAPIDLNEFLNELLPTLRRDGVLLGVFYVPQQGSVDASMDQVAEDFANELSKYD